MSEHPDDIPIPPYLKGEQLHETIDRVSKRYKKGGLLINAVKSELDEGRKFREARNDGT